MIGYLKGLVAEKYPDKFFIDVRGIGYLINTSTSTLSSLSVGKEVQIYTYLHVREDILQLYGFSTIYEKELFEKLISVSKVGPKVAISVLSSYEPDILSMAISSKDINAISQVNGVGKKTAERIVLELCDKVDVIIDRIDGSVNIQESSARVIEEAKDALASLGYSSNEVLKTVNEFLKNNNNKETNTEDIVKYALNVLGKN